MKENKIDYKAMYYHLAGRMAAAVEVLEATTAVLESATDSFAGIAEKMKEAQQNAEEIYISAEDTEV
jgi:hypothetical protein